jgi:hypothetical protein
MVADFEPRSGERKLVWKAEFYRPYRGLWLFCPVPTAFAVGYYLPPLRGWLQGSFPKVDLRPFRWRHDFSLDRAGGPDMMAGMRTGRTNSHLAS